jgi:integrase
VNGEREYRRGKTKAIVQAKFDKLVEDSLRRPLAAKSPSKRRPSSESVTVDEYLDSWLAALPTRIVDGTIGLRTLEAYDRNVRLHLRPALAGCRLADLDRARIRDLQSELFTKPCKNRKDRALGRATVGQAMRVLHTALQQAVDDGLIPENPCDRVKKPRTDDVDPPLALSSVQGSELLRKASPTSLPAGPARVASSCHLGLRQSEIVGLYESDLINDCSELLVRKGLSRPAWRHGPGCGCNQNPLVGDMVTAGRCPSRVRAPLVGKTKTAAGVRVVPIPPSLQPVFRAHLKLLKERRELLGDRWPAGSAWLFPGNLGEAPSIRVDSQRWARMVRRVLGPDAPTGTHAGRRHAATRLAEKGVPIHTAMEILGWSARELMEVYARVGTEHKRNEMARAWADIYS